MNFAALLLFLSKVVIKKETEDRFNEIKKEPEDSFKEIKMEPENVTEDRFIEIKQEANLKEEEKVTLEAMLVEDGNSNFPSSCSSKTSGVNHRGQGTEGRTPTYTTEKVPKAGRSRKRGCRGARKTENRI